MAEAIVSLLVQQLKALIGEGNKLFAELSEDIDFVKQELERMLAFLSFADAQEDNDPELAVWVDHVREVVYDTEDVVDACNLLFLSGSGRGYLRHFHAMVKSLRARYRLAPELKKIRLKVKQISEGHNRYSDRRQLKTQNRGTIEDETNLIEDDGRGATILQDESELVGMDKPKEDLKAQLLDGEFELKVISVVGMPGSGKSTLVKKVYEEVKSEFGAHAFVDSKSLDIKELLNKIVEQFLKENRQRVSAEWLARTTIDELKKFINDWLKKTKTYIIVFDDIRETATWDKLKDALPKNNSKCRVVLTKRNREVTDQNVFEMKAMSQEDLETLFFTRVFKDGNCPQHLREISKKILSKCGGLPYAVLEMAKIFGDSKTLADWEMTYDCIPRELEVYGSLDGLRRLLLASFYQLPHHLKCCLLYLSIFPDYKKMKLMHVVRLWIAEGLLEESEILTREDVGSRNLQALVNKNLLQVVRRRLDGKPKACAVQGILHEIITSKSKKGRMVTIAGQEGIQINWPEKVRRLAIHGPLAEDTVDITKFKQLRSLILFSPEGLPRKPLLSKMLCSGSRVLKVLDLGGAPLEEIPEEVFKLYLLEYLSLRSTKVRTVPKSIGKLRKLETLDLKNTFVLELPVQILKLQRLRHLILYRYEDVRVHDGVHSFRAPYKIGSLVSLQKLSYIDADENGSVKIVVEIGKLTGLRRLGITKLKREDGKDLCSSLEKLKNLCSLFLVSREPNEIIDVQALDPAPRLLRTITLRGRLENIPQWISTLQDLSKVGLLESRLENEPLKYLEDLPNLVELCLFRFYEGEEMHFKAGKFPKLKKLILADLRGLRRIRIEKNSMPCLNELILVDSKLMEDPPSGMEHLSNLQYVQLVNMDQKLVTSLNNEECRRTQARIYTGTWEDIGAVRKLQNVRFLEVAKMINSSV